MVESAQFCGFGIKSALPTGCSALEVRVESFWLLPVGFNTLTVHLTVDKAAQYIEFLKQAFDAVELTRSPSADGRLLNSSVRVGNSVMMMNDIFPEFGGEAYRSGRAVRLTLYVPD